jgi:hypothetical protein
MNLVTARIAPEAMLNCSAFGQRLLQLPSLVSCWQFGQSRWMMLIWCVVLASSGSIAAGQDWARKMFTEFRHDFGTVVKGEEAEHRFSLQNIYLEEIEIDRVSSSCGCAQVSYTTKKMKTWEKSEIVVKFNTKQFSGQRQATISVSFAKPFRGEVQLTIVGHIRTDIQIQPGSIDFGSGAIANIKSQVVKITKYGNPNWSIRDVQSAFAGVSVELSKPRRFFDRTEYELKASLRPDVPPGFFQGELFLLAVEGSREDKIPLPFSGKLSAPLEISPQILDFEKVAAGQTVSRKVVLKSDQPFAIKDVICSEGGFACEAKRDAKKVHFVELKFTADETIGRRETAITFVTDIGGELRIDLPTFVTIE